ncbi:MAG: HNH endonuclease [Lachnospiraceae bacterium]|nr:HNH endonuclease [Lachnospiraceae bacterium]
MYKFYQTPEWKALRVRVLQANHGECEDCRCKSPSVITPAVTVHHDKEVDRFPELALSTFWIDAKGRKHQQLFALCNNCHNKRHDRYFDGHKREDEEPLTPERW